MGSVIAGMVMSLDGYIEDKNGSVGALYPDMEAMRESLLVQEAMRDTGAVVMGRGAYDMANGDFTGYEFQAPIFVITHHAPEQPAKGENDKLKFHFITDGVHSAIQQAKAAAGERDVYIIGGAAIVQRALNGGLLDRLDVSIAPVFLDGGLRLFENIDPVVVKLGTPRVVQEGAQVTLLYPVKT